MNEIDWLKLAVTAGFAGVIAVLATIAIERFGGKLGGVIATLPTTIIPASLGFWYLSQSSEAFIIALWSVPIGMLLDAAFLHSWRWLPRLITGSSVRARLFYIVCASLGLWFVVALGVVSSVQFYLPYIKWIGGAAALAQLGYGLYASPPTVVERSTYQSASVSTLALRGIMAGGAIATAALIIAIGHPILAGVASVFPAIFLTVMVSVWLSQGPVAQDNAVGPMMLGSTSVSVYALVASWTLPQYGAVLGVSIAWCIAVGCVSLPCAAFLKRKKAD